MEELEALKERNKKQKIQCQTPCLEPELHANAKRI